MWVGQKVVYERSGGGKQLLLLERDKRLLLKFTYSYTAAEEAEEVLRERERDEEGGGVLTTPLRAEGLFLISIIASFRSCTKPSTKASLACRPVRHTCRLRERQEGKE